MTDGTGPTLGVGVDIVDVADVSDALARHGERYLRRVYTDGEIAECRTPSGEVAAGRLAERYAAKEAVVKALALEDLRVPWRAIEIRLGEGSPQVRLTGSAERLAAAGTLSVSTARERRGAAAVAVAVAHGGVPA